MDKKSLSREKAEEKEGLKQVSNDVPENRYQETQQIADVQSVNKTEPSQSSFQKKETKAKGSVLKQEAISDAITGSNNSAGMGINAAGRGVSGTAGGVLGANNSTPSADKSRSVTRTGKKFDRVATKLNYTPSEQVILQVDESKPLADAASEDQGYNGTYRNENARSQKIMGAVPADLMYQRSVDFIMKDKLYFVEGQQVFQVSGEDVSVNPTKTVNPVTGEVEDVVYHSGNFLHRAMHVGINAQGQVEYVYFDVDDLSCGLVSADDANCAAANRLIKNNVAELDRINMDAKAGDEKAELWSPLGRAVQQPTQTSYLLSSIEADVGAYAYLAYSKASTNMAYQLNRGPKDGLSVKIPAIEQILGWRSCTDTSTVYDTFTMDKDSTTGVFTSTNYALGDPSLMIEAYDSVAKYNNKADLLLQPRGWRMHLQTADNNINPLKIPTLFANVYASNECFSTIDHDYDPLLPVCMTDKANLITVHNFNELGAFYKHGGFKHLVTTLTATNLSAGHAKRDVILAKKNCAKYMGWTHLYVYYKKDAGDGLVYDSTNNIIKWDADSTNGERTIEVILSNEVIATTGFVQLADVALNHTQDLIYQIPIVDSTGTNAVTAVKTEIIGDDNWHYVNGSHFAYSYSDLRNNYIVDVKHPLIEGIVQYINESIGGKLRNLLNGAELYVPFIFSTQYMTLAQLLICAATPWICKVRMNSMKDVIYYEDNLREYPFSKLDSIKNVPFKNFLNFTYTDYDSPLQTKIMNPVQAINWIMPEFFWKVDTEKYVLPWYFCENDLNADGTVNDDESTMCMPSIRSGVRLGLLDTFYDMSEKDIRLSLDRMTKTFLRDTDITGFGAYKYGRTTDGQILALLDSNKLFTVGKILKAPRELGLVMDAPLGVLTIDPADASSGYYLWDKSHVTYKSLAVDGTASSYRIKIWVNPNTIEHPTILAATGVNITRAANYSQKWFEITANGATSNLDLAGLVFGLGDDYTTMYPFATLGTGAQMTGAAYVETFQRSMNTRIQFLPFVISPFDSVSNGSNTYTHDIYDFAYMFGLCGFRASDYRESIYNREKEVVNQGLLFVDDPWVIDSPLIKGAVKSTGVKISKGYEVK